MPEESTFSNGHRLLTHKMRRLGYQASHEGMCEGVALMGAQATLLGELDIFCKTISTILETEKLSHHHKYKTGILPLLDGIQMHQDGNHRHKHLTNKSIIEPIERSSAIVATDSIEKLGGMVLAHRHIGIYNIRELAIHLASLREMTQDAEYFAPFTFYVESECHGVNISYDTFRNIWILVDANHLPVKTFETDQELASHLASSFYNHNLNGVMALTFSALTLGCRKEFASEFIQKWRHSPDYKAANRIDTAKAMMVDQVYNVNLLHLAVTHHNERLAHQLLSLGANPNIPRKTNDKFNGETPLFTTIYHHDINLVKLLLRYGADPSIRRSRDNLTAKDIARHFQNKEIIELLNKSKKQFPLRHAWLNARMFTAKRKQHQFHHSHPHFTIK